MPLAGKALLAWSVAAFARHPAVTDLLVVVPEGWQEHAQRNVLLPLTGPVGRHARIHRPIAGGVRRQDSARLGLEAMHAAIPEAEQEDARVLVHDAARPVVGASLVDRLLSSLSRGLQEKPGVAGVIPALPVADTLKAVGRYLLNPVPPGGLVARTIPRQGLWAVQTPQAFCLSPLLEAHQEALAADMDVTDDAMLYEWMGWPVRTIEGSRFGLKVTYAEDLALVDAYLTAHGEVLR